MISSIVHVTTGLPRGFLPRRSWLLSAIALASYICCLYEALRSGCTGLPGNVYPPTRWMSGSTQSVTMACVWLGSGSRMALARKGGALPWRGVYGVCGADGVEAVAALPAHRSNMESLSARWKPPGWIGMLSCSSATRSKANSKNANYFCYCRGQTEAAFAAPPPVAHASCVRSSRNLSKRTPERNHHESTAKSTGHGGRR